MRLIQCLTILSLTLALTGCGAVNSLFETDNTEPPAPLVEFKPEVPVKSLWSRSAGSGTDDFYLKLTPALQQDMLYVADASGNIYAMDGKNGHSVWSVSTKAPISSGMSVSGNMLVAATSDARTIALNKSNGAMLWQTPMSNEILAAPSVAGQQVFVKSVDGRLAALSRDTGKVQWAYDHTTPELILRASSSPAISNGYVAAGFSDGQLAVFARSTGRKLWQHHIAQSFGASPVERMVDIDADPIVSDGVVYVATYQGNIAANDLRNGRSMWHRKMSSFTGMTLGRYVFITDEHSHVWAINRNSGKVMWRQKKLHARGITAPVLVGNQLAVGDKLGYIHFLSQADGHFVARVKTGSAALIAAPVVHEHSLYSVNARGYVNAYHIG